MTAVTTIVRIEDYIKFLSESHGNLMADLNEMNRQKEEREKFSTEWENSHSSFYKFFNNNPYSYDHGNDDFLENLRLIRKRNNLEAVENQLALADYLKKIGEKTLTISSESSFFK